MSWLLLGICLLRPTLGTALPYNVSISDQDLSLTYTPSRDGSSSVAWNCSYSGSPWSDRTTTTVGSGTLSHYTTASGASVSIGFVGTAAYIYGSAESEAYQLIVDGGVKSSTTSSGLLGVITGLDYGWHDVAVKSTGSGGVTFTGFIITTQFGGDGLITSMSTTDAVTDGVISEDLQLYGNWKAGTDAAPGSNTYEHAYSSDLGDSLIFGVPANTTMIIMRGSSRNTHGAYSIVLNPKFTSQVTPANQSFTGNTAWMTLDNIMYFASGLDPTVKYAVTIENHAWASVFLTSVLFGIVSQSDITITSAVLSSKTLTSQPVTMQTDNVAISPTSLVTSASNSPSSTIALLDSTSASILKDPTSVLSSQEIMVISIPSDTSSTTVNHISSTSEAPQSISDASGSSVADSTSIHAGMSKTKLGAIIGTIVAWVSMMIIAFILVRQWRARRQSQKQRDEFTRANGEKYTTASSSDAPTHIGQIPHNRPILYPLTIPNRPNGYRVVSAATSTTTPAISPGTLLERLRPQPLDISSPIPTYHDVRIMSMSTDNNPFFVDASSSSLPRTQTSSSKTRTLSALPTGQSLLPFNRTSTSENTPSRRNTSRTVRTMRTLGPQSVFTRPGSGVISASGGTKSAALSEYPWAMDNESKRQI